MCVVVATAAAVTWAMCVGVDDVHTKTTIIDDRGRTFLFLSSFLLFFFVPTIVCFDEKKDCPGGNGGEMAATLSNGNERP